MLIDLAGKTAIVTGSTAGTGLAIAQGRADGKAARSPDISYSIGFQSWRICRLDGHLAYELSCDDELPPTDCPWNVYKMGVAPAPKVVIHHGEPR